jgi:hypothetical protein
MKMEYVCDYCDIRGELKPGGLIPCLNPSRCGVRIQEGKMERDPLLQTRQETHGNFRDNARISQRLKSEFRKDLADTGHAHLLYRTPVHAEALDMIAVKLSRLLSGQLNFKDHWDDIAGYARLGSEACE